MARRIVCACCGKPGTYGGYGWKRACYDRWDRAGRPETGPPRPHSHGSVTARARRADYVELLSYGVRDAKTLAARLGVSERTVQRYASRLRADLEVAA